MKKNLILQNSLIQTAAENLDGDEFKDFILKINDYFLDGVIPDFQGKSKLLFDMTKDFLDYMSKRFDKKISERLDFNKLSEL